MGEMGGAVTYLYWSQRRAERFLNDNGIKVRSYTEEIGTPPSSWIPTIKKIKEVKHDQRPEIASTIESRLGASAVTAFNGPAPIMYAKATGSIIFGEFVGGADDDATRKPAVIFTSCDYDDDDRNSVAICLFGSMDNFEGAIQEAGPVQVRGGGWHSSSAPYVFNFLKTHGKASNRGLEQLAWDALQIAGEQGFNAYKDAPFGFDRPWLRAFTYGDLQDAAEWLAEIYLDIDFLNTKGLVAGRKWGFRRVLVGAPFWIRTPKPQAMRLYAKHRPDCLRTNSS